LHTWISLAGRLVLRERLVHRTLLDGDVSLLIVAGLATGRQKCGACDERKSPCSQLHDHSPRLISTQRSLEVRGMKIFGGALKKKQMIWRWYQFFVARIEKLIRSVAAPSTCVWTSRPLRHC
jgi:hypothetical protein